MKINSRKRIRDIRKTPSAESSLLKNSLAVTPKANLPKTFRQQINQQLSTITLSLTKTVLNITVTGDKYQCAGQICRIGLHR